MFHNVVFFTRPGTVTSITASFAQMIQEVCNNNDVKWSPPTATNFADEQDSRTLFVALGGDGTVLRATKEAIRHPSAAVLGLNLGHLGFLAEEVGDMITNETFKQWFGYVLREDLSAIKYDQRNVLHISAMTSLSDPAPIKTFALNEVTFTPKTMAAMLDCEIHINDEFVAHYRGSGALIASATGSTAMAASAGGAIVAPNTAVLQIVPVLAHELTIRPIICSSKDVIELRTHIDERMTDFEIAVDGQPIVIFDDIRNRLGQTYRIIVERAHRRVQFIRPTNWSFFATLSRKMGWNNKKP